MENATCWRSNAAVLLLASSLFASYPGLLRCYRRSRRRRGLVLWRRGDYSVKLLIISHFIITTGRGATSRLDLKGESGGFGALVCEEIHSLKSLRPTSHPLNRESIRTRVQPPLLRFVVLLRNGL